MLEKSASLSAGSLVAVRVSRSGETAIVKDQENKYQTISLETGSALSDATPELMELTKDGSWRRPSVDESTSLVASLTTEAPDVIVEEAEASVKPYRVPAAVKEEIANALDFYTQEFSDTDREIAGALANNETVGIREVEWVNRFFCDTKPYEQLRGGYKGQVWASKIVSGEDGGSYDYDPYAKYDFDDEDNLAYYGIGPDADTNEANRLIAVEVITKSVLEWTPEGFVETGLVAEDIDEPLVMPIDRTTAEVLARWLDEDPVTARDLRDTDPTERNLWDLAEPEIDFESLDRVFAVIADASGYTPAERSINARRQIRGAGGKFGGRQVKQGTKLLAFKKGKLADKLPLVLNPGQVIQAWIQTAEVADDAVTAAAGDSQSIGQPSPDPMPPTQTGGEKTMEQPQGAAQPTGSAIYFAVVDAADTTAVLEMIAITKGADGNPQAWIRKRGKWQADPATLTKLTGATPPPVVQLNDPEPAKTVIAQVDASDANLTKFPTDPVPTEEPPAPVTASGFITTDATVGIFSVEDLAEAVSTFDSLDPQTKPEAKRLIRRRARALNRMDIVPEEWRTASTVEVGEEIASTSPLYGPHGQVLVAAGSKHRGNATQLKAYWTHGKGAAKIRWGTPGDLTRAHRHLAKYVDPNRAWGLAQSYHKSLFGVPNITHDRATGQYRSPRRGK